LPSPNGARGNELKNSTQLAPRRRTETPGSQSGRFWAGALAIAWLAKFSPPPGKLIKIVVALSDEHVFNLTGGRVTKSGQPARASGGYTLNPKGQPHSALIGTETVSLVIYCGEPDEITSMEVVDLELALEEKR
jgi:hypothetical protein